MAANAWIRLERSAEKDNSRRESTWMPTLALVLNAQPRRRITEGEQVDANACTRLERSTVKTDHGESTWKSTLALVSKAQPKRQMHSS